MRASKFKKVQNLLIGSLQQKHLILIMSVIVGFTSGLVAVIIKNGVFAIEHVLTSGFDEEQFNFLFVAFPLIGILVTIFIVLRVFKHNPGHGVPAVLYAISKRKSILKRKDMYSSLISSVFTVGFGGSAGLEGPTVQTSAAIGSNLAAQFKLDYKTKTLLIGCASSAALAAIFKAPIGGIIFSVEVIMIDFTSASLIPLLLASISALLTANMFLGDETVLRFTLRDNVDSAALPFYILLGVFAGVFSIYFNKIYLGITSITRKVSKLWLRGVVGGLMLGIIIFVFPALYGEGYEVINALLRDDLASVTSSSFFYEYTDSVPMMLIFLSSLVIFKVVATGITLTSGGIGGMFAPTLFTGATLGFLFSKALAYFNISHLSASNFTLVGMAGLMAGVLHAPLTAIFLIAEITGGYDLFVPLMITSAIAFSTSKGISKHNLYTRELAEKGELITHNKDKTVLTLMDVMNEIETDFKSVSADDTLGDLVQAISKSKRNLFPVLGPNRSLVGVVTLEDVRQVMFDKSQYDEIKVEQIMVLPPEHIYTTDKMDSVMRKFEESKAWNLPVINGTEYLGFISKSRLYSAYRNLLREVIQE